MPDPKQDDNENKLVAKVARFKQLYPKRSRAIVYVASIVISFAVPLILSFNGTTWELTKDGVLTFRGYAFIAICAGLLFTVQFLFDEADKELEKTIARLKQTLVEIRESRTVLAGLNKSTKVICDSKLHTLSELLQSCLNKSDAVPPLIVSNPTQQLTILATELASRLNLLLYPQEVVHEQELFVSILYRFPQRDKQWQWHWATPEGDIEITELMKKHNDKPNSTVRKMLEENKPSIFENSKQKAFENGAYIKCDKDEYDDEDKLKGSIACYRGIVKQADKRLIELVISITSYDRQFLDTSSENPTSTEKAVRKNLKTSVMPNYLTRASIELCLLYLEKLHEEYQKKDTKSSCQ